MNPSVHLSEGLSQALVAFTIEYDNDWEEKFWLPLEAKPLRVSMVMWENFLRLVPAEGISLRELSAQAGYPAGKSHPSIAGMLRWRFVTAAPGADGKKGKLDQIIRATSVGRKAGEYWTPLAAEIESRWCRRFSTEKVHELKEALVDLVARFDSPLPRYFPVLGHLDGMRAPIPFDLNHDAVDAPAHRLALPNLLSKAIHRYTILFEESSDLSLAQRSNVLRVLSPEGVPMRSIPALAGISKEALKMAYGFLSKSDLMLEEPSGSGRGKDVRLTGQGLKERDRYGELQRDAETRWEDEFSHEVIARVRASVHAILAHAPGTESPLFLGLTPPPGTWRAALPRPCVLPHHPMVLHRGGWPDGS